MSDTTGDNQLPAEGYIDRIVSLEEEVSGIRRDIREIYDDAKEAGYTKGALRIVVKRRLESEEQRAYEGAWQAGQAAAVDKLGSGAAGSA